MCVWSSLSADWASTGYGYQSCLWSAKQGNWNFPCPRCSCLRVWSRELDSAVRSRVSLLILHAQDESCANLKESTPLSRFPLRFPVEPSCAVRIVPSLTGHAILRYRLRSLPRIRRHRDSISQGISVPIGAYLGKNIC